MSSGEWSSLPILPLKCVLDHLSLEDALAATTTCRNWRLAMLVYEGRRKTLTLNTKELDKSIYLTRVFRKRVKRLQIKLDCELNLNYFMQIILPKFYDTTLYEIQFVGPEYLGQDNGSVVTLKRPIMDNLLNVHRHTLKNLTLIGCEIAAPQELEEFGEDLKKFSLTKCNIKANMFSSLQQMCLDYESLDPELLEGLSTLPNMTRLALNVRDRKGQYEPLPWGVLDKQYPSQLKVTLNIIRVPLERFEEIVDNILVENLPLVALRVMFCKTLHEPLIMHVITLYHPILQELHWADSLYSLEEIKLNTIHVPSAVGFDSGVINPFILVCWRCHNLQSLTVHGYAMSCADVVGVCRLRGASLRALALSALCVAGRSPRPAPRLPPAQPPLHQINSCLQFKFQPVKKLSSLHPALRPKSNDADKSRYILEYALEPFKVT